ncbi:MAG: rRNA maturation RNase YbeY [Candidatus Magasanikbacteria bacterium]
MSVECNVYTETKNTIFTKEEIREFIDKIMQELEQEGLVSVHRIKDEQMKKLNSEYRDKDETTDVLSFAMNEGLEVKQKQKDLGDIFISIPQIKKQAQQRDINEKEELKRMLVHGVLHLLGYDHKEEEEAKKMFSQQEELIKKL